MPDFLATRSLAALEDSDESWHTGDVMLVLDDRSVFVPVIKARTRVVNATDPIMMTAMSVLSDTVEPAKWGLLVDVIVSENQSKWIRDHHEQGRKFELWINSFAYNGSPLRFVAYSLSVFAAPESNVEINIVRYQGHKREAPQILWVFSTVTT